MKSFESARSRGRSPSICSYFVAYSTSAALSSHLPIIASCLAVDFLNPDKLAALEPPPGIIPNFDDPYSAAPPVEAATGVLAALATLGFLARIFTKAWVMKQMQIEDCGCC